MNLKHLVPESKQVLRLIGTCPQDTGKEASAGQIWNPLNIKKNDSIITGWTEKKIHKYIMILKRGGKREEALLNIRMQDNCRMNHKIRTSVLRPA